MSANPTFEEWLACTELDFEWAESYDSKVILDCHATCERPSIDEVMIGLGSFIGEPCANTPSKSLSEPWINYAKVTNQTHTALPASEFLAQLRSPLFLGEALVDSQHFVGAAAKWVRVSDSEVIGTHQSRAAHIRWTDIERSGVAAKGHGHGHIEITYKKVDGVWKWGGIKTLVRWNEHEWEKVFLGVDGESNEMYKKSLEEG